MTNAIIRRLMGTMVRIRDLAKHVGEAVTVNGWLYNKRTSGKLQFPIIRDGSGFVQCVVSKKEVSEESWNDSDRATQESTVTVPGHVVAEPRAPGGGERHVQEFKVSGVAGPYPISPKEHGAADAFTGHDVHTQPRDRPDVGRRVEVHGEVALVEHFAHHLPGHRRALTAGGIHPDFDRQLGA